MTQAQVDLVRNCGIHIVKKSSHTVVCRLSVSEELIIKKSKGEIKLFYKDQNKRVTISEALFVKLYDLGKSIQQLTSFIKGNKDVV